MINMSAIIVFNNVQPEYTWKKKCVLVLVCYDPLNRKYDPWSLYWIKLPKNQWITWGFG